ncbi:hypothetical protein C7T36_21780 [Rhodococcus sp. AD45-ID]|uniref:hypothetical protein n=1 Tax=unclassified Rhodococcus (in: high G+C Gram-positive bacteria) TaxID=192944 RepID=UPI0005D30036|nr:MULTISPECIES: hypothetical protein [unclassified Rhodococcus (in: high G+C Gram-positive bacteria)]KJF22624.1 hypothetical protein SZ00_03278 [Rhodococcus sp. AD45]NRI64421.1 hypothetical protein [Rhodococcus sp. MS16]PSR40221.1 hypothetical protein C7T36_21780 [Rhodococcus sp. AD45-ID]
MTTHFEPSASPETSRSSQRSLTVNRLAAEFSGRISPECIDIVVEGCIADLSWASSKALPELSERLARQRIISYLDSKANNFD